MQWKIISVPWKDEAEAFDARAVSTALDGLAVEVITPVVHRVDSGVQLTLVAQCQSPPPPRTAQAWRDRLAPQDRACFDRLEAWRATEAHSQGRPAYSVLTNRAAAGLASLRPRTPEELLEVPGVGPVTVERFGQTLLALLTP